MSGQINFSEPKVGQQRVDYFGKRFLVLQTYLSYLTINYVGVDETISLGYSDPVIKHSFIAKHKRKLYE